MTSLFTWLFPKKTFYLTVRTCHNQFESNKRGQNPYGMGHSEMAIRIMGYQNCVIYRREYERRLGTSFCSLITLKRKVPKFLHDNKHSNNNDFLDKVNAVTS